MAHAAKYKQEALGRMFAHWDRTFDTTKRLKQNIIQEKISDNYNIGQDDGYKTVKEKLEVVNTLKKQNGKRKVRKDAILVFDWVVTLPTEVLPDDEYKFFELVHQFCCERYGEENTLACRVHKDEVGRTHCHQPIMPVMLDNGVPTFNCKKVLTRNDLRTWHQDLQDLVNHELGYNVSILLDDDKKLEKSLSQLPQDEFIAMDNELKSAVNQAEMQINDIKTKSKAASDELDVKKYEAAAWDRTIELKKQQVDTLEDQVTEKEWIEWIMTFMITDAAHKIDLAESENQSLIDYNNDLVDQNVRLRTSNIRLENRNSYLENHLMELFNKVIDKLRAVFKHLAPSFRTDDELLTYLDAGIDSDIIDKLEPDKIIEEVFQDQFNEYEL